jgi:hypothetical protein
MRWAGWPMLAFVCTTVYGQLISVYEYPQAALLVLGGSTLLAVAVGAVYGRGKRVWCRYLCPVSGVFALLARLSPLQWRSDPQRWRAFEGPRERVDCPPLLDLRHLDSAADCHACGRCSGHRGAVALTLRSPHREILGADARADANPYPARLLVFGLLGLAPGAFQWSGSAVFVQARQAAAQWAVEHGHFALLDDRMPWWLLTHQPEASDLFNPLDGLAIVAYIGLSTLLLGGLCWLALRAAARLCRPAGAADGGLHWQRLALALVPLAGIGLFLGLSMTTMTLLRAEGITPGWVGPLRGVLLAAGIAWSGWLGGRQLAAAPVSAARRLLAGLCLAAALAAVGATWVATLHLG